VALRRRADPDQDPFRSSFSPNMKQLFIPLFAAALLLASSAATQAQGPGVGGPRPGATTEVPLDGGASLLLAAGAAYGLRKLRRPRA